MFASVQRNLRPGTRAAYDDLLHKIQVICQGGDGSGIRLPADQMDVGAGIDGEVDLNAVVLAPGRTAFISLMVAGSQ